MIKIYKFVWGNNEKRLSLKNRKCKVLTYGKKNSIMVEFLDNNQREVISRNSVRLCQTYCTECGKEISDGKHYVNCSKYKSTYY